MNPEEALRTLEGERARGIEAFESAGSLDELEAAQVGVLGRKAPFSQAQRSLGAFEPDDRRRVGLVANEVRAALQAALEGRRRELRGRGGGGIAGRRRRRRHAAGPPPARGVAAPPHHRRAADRRRVHAHGLPRGAGPADRDRLVQLRGIEHPAGPSGAHDEGLALPRRPRPRAAASNRDLRHADPHDGDRRARRSTSWLRAACSGARPPTRPTPRSSIRSRAWRWTRDCRSPT